MWNKIRAWWRNVLFSNGHEMQAETIQKIVTVNALNRRKNTRIKYSHIGAVGNLPKIFFNGDEMNIGNVSTGGLLIIDDTGRLGETVGETITLELRWADTTINLRSRVVGANLHRRHIQFVDFNPTVFVRISALIKPGFLGSKFFKVDTQRANIAATELWIGPTNESLVFHKPGSGPTGAPLPYAELHVNGENYEFNLGQLPKIKSTGQIIPSGMLSELLVLLCNLRDPTEKVRDLIERNQALYQNPQKRQLGGTGTHG
jgi:hypothetical protein